MNPYRLHSAIETSTLVLIVAFAAACGASDVGDESRDESFLALMGSGGKADTVNVSEDSPEAQAVLHIANTLPYRDLQISVKLDRRAAANIVAYRDRDATNPHDDNVYDTLAELDHTPWVGMDAFQRLYDFAESTGTIEQFRHPVACAVDADCGTGTCVVDHCYDAVTIELPASSIQAFEVAADGTWWARASSGSATVREMRGRNSVDEFESSSFFDADIDSWLPALPDGALTAVTRTCHEVVPEFGATLAMNPLNLPVDAAYAPDGTLYVAAEARDSNGTPQGIVVLRQGADGWTEEFKYAFDGARTAGEKLTARFTHDADGDLQLWTDIDQASRRFDRTDLGARAEWRATVTLDMSGFGSRAADRTVEFLQAADGTVFVHRQAWVFSRSHEVVRVDGDQITDVVRLSTTVRGVGAQADGDLTLVYADGTLGVVTGGEERRSAGVALASASQDDIVRTHGDDIYVVQGSLLTRLTSR